MMPVSPQSKVPLESRWLKPPEAAAYARVTLSKIRQWIAEGILPVAVTRNKLDLSGKGASGYVLDRQDVDKLMEQLKIRMGDSASPRASGQTGRQHMTDRGGYRSALQPARNGPYVRRGRGKSPPPDEPA